MKRAENCVPARCPPTSTGPGCKGGIERCGIELGVPWLRPSLRAVDVSTIALRSCPGGHPWTPIQVGGKPAPSPTPACMITTQPNAPTSQLPGQDAGAES